MIDVNSDGSKGYYSVFYVLAKSPYQKLEDLKGKNLGLVDPNSTSGNNMPRFKMNQMGIDPDTYFSQVVFTGSHENAVLALAQGTVDVCANWWNAEDDSNLTRMLAKNMVKSSDGKPLKKEDFRIIVKSDLIINSPYAYLSDLPEDMKAAIKKAFLEAADKDKEAFDKLSDGKNLPWQPVANDDYNKTIELIKFVDSLRKKGVLIANPSRSRVDRPGSFFFLTQPADSGFMTVAVPVLPAQQLAALNDAYRKAVARKRLRFTMAAAVFFAALVIAAVGAEVNLRTLFTYFGHFVSYFDRLLTLDSGGRVWTNIPEWLWGWKKWSLLLGETILISYVGTLSGAVLGFGLNFLAAENTSPGPWTALHRQAPDGILPHGAGYRVRADLRHRLRPRPDGGRAGDHDPFDRRARQAIFRNGREHRHEAGRGAAFDRRQLDRLDALCRAAAGRGRLRQLHAAALRDQCAQRLGDGLCRRRWHRRGADHVDPQVLLLRCQRDPADD